MDTIIDIKRVNKNFRSINVLNNITVKFETGLVHGIVGKNGSGKTLMAKLICGLLRPDTGEVRVNGQLIGKETDFPLNTGAIIETPGFIPYYSGYKNLEYLASFYPKKKKKNISLVGGTGDGGKVSANGKIYSDAVAYALVKNKNGKVKAYKENIYRQMDNYRFIASKTDKANYMLGKLNGVPAKQVYQDILHVTEKEILTQTFKNPFGKINGDDTCIISIKEVNGDALTCFRQVNDSDVLILLELGDYKEIVKNTIRQIRQDFPKISAVFSVNCLFRYLLFTENHYMKEYLNEMAALGNHAGLVGYGEHYNNRFVNQSMTCVVFE